MKLKEMFEDVGNYISLKQFIITLTLVVIVAVSFMNFIPPTSIGEVFMYSMAITFVFFASVVSYNVAPHFI